MALRGKRFEVQGRVQGVGFRAYVLGLADELSLRGEVWNRCDGGVEVIAYSESPEAIDRIEERLRNGPGRVDHVISGPADFAYVPADFRSTFTR